MRSIFPLGLTPVSELEVGLVDEIRRLERVTPPVASQVAFRKPAQLFVNHRHELIDRRFVRALRVREPSIHPCRCRDHRPHLFG